MRLIKRYRRHILLITTLIILFFVIHQRYYYESKSTEDYKIDEEDVTTTIASFIPKDRLLNGSQVTKSYDGLDENHDVFLSEASTDVKTLQLLDRVEARIRKGQSLEIDFKDKDDLPNFVQVIVVPHSHNDPGWLRTPESYFEEYTQIILDSMLEKLMEHPQMTFVWAETVFLSMWWNKLTDTQKEVFDLLVNDKRLEIVGGGWVVPDEAITYYTSLIMNFLEGHQWLKKNVEVKPKVSWSLDPFGYSSFFPYLYKLIGLKSSIILRVNTYVKKEMEMEHMLHFKWRQNWDVEGTFDMETFMLPFMLYNIKHQCGPDPDVCLKFDFRNIAGEPSESRAEEVNQYNLVSLAEELTDQFKKKASLQKNNKVVLIPLGDDFRYDKTLEWDQQYKNYMKLFDYINKTPSLGVQVQFGVISDFFELLAKQNKNEKKKSNEDQNSLYSLSGDFFPYTDRDNDYWTGFYTTRIWLKKYTRILESTLNVAELIHVNALIYANKVSFNWLKYNKKVEVLLTKARQTVSLMQHHDAITGTSTSHVTKHYKDTVLEAIRMAEQSAQKSMHTLFSFPHFSEDFFPELMDGYFKFDLVSEDLSEQEWTGNNVIVGNSGVNLVVFNPIIQRFSGIISYHVEVTSHGSGFLSKLSRKLTHVTDEIKLILRRFDAVENKEGKSVAACHIDDFQLSEGKLLLSFADVIAPLGFALYKLMLTKEDSNNIDICNKTQYQQTHSNNSKEIVLENECMKAMFDSTTGHLLAYELLESNRRFKMVVKFMIYDGVKDGAYIFGAIKAAREFEPKTPNRIYHSKSNVYSSVKVHMDNLFVINYRLPTFNCNPDVNDIFIDVSVNMTKSENNMNLIMRIDTDLKSYKYFYTDSNGFSSIVRKRLPSLPIEANYYPATSYIFIQHEENHFYNNNYDSKQDEHSNNEYYKSNSTKQPNISNEPRNIMDKTRQKKPSLFFDYRVTLLMRESRGVSSQHSGSLEVMLDRKSSYSDGRGMSEGITDNIPVTSSFHLLLEKVKRPNFDGVNDESRNSFVVDLVEDDDNNDEQENGLFRHPTLATILSLQSFRNRPSVFMSSLPLDHLLNTLPHFNSLYQNYTFPCDLSLALLRHVSTKPKIENKSLNVSALLVLHRYAAEMGSTTFLKCNSLYNFGLPSRGQLTKDCTSFSIKNLFPHENLIGAKSSSLTLLKVDGSNVDVGNGLCLNASSLHSYVIQFGSSHT